MNKLLPAEYYLDQDIVKLAKSLLGKVLCSEIDGKLTSGIIVETEAYKAPEDKASHAYNNRKTKRTSVMFENGGISYVYLCYGIHHMFNVVSAPKDQAHAILVRALQPVDGIELMTQRRGQKIGIKNLCSGPGKLTQAMGINRSHNGKSLFDRLGPFWIENRAKIVLDEQIISTPRVGIAYANECAHWPWRFRVKDNAYTSRPDTVTYPQI